MVTAIGAARPVYFGVQMSKISAKKPSCTSKTPVSGLMRSAMVCSSLCLGRDRLASSGWRTSSAGEVSPCSRRGTPAFSRCNRRHTRCRQCRSCHHSHHHQRTWPRVQRYRYWGIPFLSPSIVLSPEDTTRKPCILRSDNDPVVFSPAEACALKGQK